MTPIATALQMNQAEFIDLDGSGTLSVGESIYLRPNTYNIDVIYAALDGTNDTCSYGVIVDSGITPVCNDNVNVSLSGGCQAVILPDNILEGECVGIDDFTVRLLDGANADTNFVDISYLNQTVRVEVIENTSGNKCWGTITVEDKFAPTITCQDLSLIHI